MGRIFTVPPSPFERDHAAGILAGMTYQAEHDGALPDTPMWRMLERRKELAPARFDHWHPNLALMIERLPLNHPAIPEGWTGHMRGGALAPLTVPPAAVAGVPEPSSLALCCVGLAVVLWVTWMMKGVKLCSS
jgi:hypothetical protein